MLPSVRDSEITGAIKDALASEGVVIFQLCLANAAGRKKQFIARNETEFELVLRVCLDEQLFQWCLRF